MTTHDLALFGGTPIRTQPFPTWPRTTDAIRSAVLQTLENDTWGVGSQAITRFLTRFAEFQGAKYCIATNSGTAALWVALKAAGVRAGDEVIVPAYTFIATGAAVLMANAVPVFVDVDPETFNLDPEQLAGAITARTKVILPVHIAGNPADMDRIRTVAGDIVVIEDAAQAHGAEWNHHKVGALGLGGIFSFQTSKNMSAGEGGAIVSNDQDFIDACFSYHNCGRVRDGKWYEHHRLGGNFRMTALAASMLNAQFETTAEELKLRETNRKRLDAFLNDLEGLTPAKSYTGTTRSANHLYLSRYNREAFNNVPREVFFKAMQAEGVYTYAGYTPLYRERLFSADTKEYPWLEGRAYASLHLPVTERLATEEAVWLKQHHLLGTEQDLQDIMDAFEKVTSALQSDPKPFLDWSVK
ncbi:MAG: DegT/DnrJ/EryC1/StrS family aminotransferase [FCB group bacterium]|nr:DegT/DnrJ/EryC1/StrS family aminotransferase [FCB group bacterium]